MIKYIPMIKDFEKVKYDSSKEYVLVPDLFFLSSSKKMNIFYSSLFGIVYLVSDEEKTKVNEKNLSGHWIKKLVECGLLVEKDNINFPKENPDMTRNSKIHILLTRKCNSKCVYCYGRGGEVKDTLNFEIAKDFIDEFLPPNTSCCIHFHGGGEQTIEFNLLKKIVNYSKEKNNQVEFFIQSNGVIEGSKLNFLLKENFDIGISCDGYPEIQNKQRPLIDGSPSSEIVENTIDYILRRKGKLSIRTTISKYSQEKQVKILEYFKKLGVDRVKFEPISKSGRSLDFSQDISEPPDPKVFIENLLKAKELSDEYGIKLMSIFIDFSIKDRFCGVSYPFLCLTQKGRLTSCYEAEDFTEKIADFFYGQYNPETGSFDVDSRKIDKLRERVVYNIPKCKECFLKYACAGGCAMRAFQKNGDFFEPDLERCEIRKEIMEKIIKYRVERNILKIKPYLKENGDFLDFIMNFNRFKLKKSRNDTKISSSSYVLIDNPKIDFKKLWNDIRHLKNEKEFKTTLFIFSFELKNLIGEIHFKKNLSDFLRKLKKEGIFFKISKPLPPCILDIQTQGHLKNQIPRSFRDCLDMFRVNQNNDVILCNNKKANKKINLYLDRNEIFKEFNFELKFSEDCENCIYKIRQKCKGHC